MKCPLLIAGLLAFSLSLIAKGYIIDDTNSTIQYSPPVDGTLWSHNKDMNNSMTFNHTSTGSLCDTVDHCHVKIPFTGSGITLYNVMYFTFYAKYSIDGGRSKSYLYDSPCYPNVCYNVSTIDIQSLPYGNHILDIALLSHDNFFSFFELDYVLVNDTDSGVATAAGYPTHLPCGVLAGLAAIATIMLAFFCLRRRNHQYSPIPTEINPHHKGNIDSVFLVDPTPSLHPEISKEVA